VKAVLAAASTLVPLSSGLAGFGYSLESAVHTFLTTYLGGNSSWPMFQTMGDLLAIPSDLFDMVLGLVLVGGAFGVRSSSIGDYAADLILTLAGLVLDVLAYVANAAHDFAAAFVESLWSIIFGAKAIYDLKDDLEAPNSQFLPGLKSFEILSDVLGVTSEGVGIAQFVVSGT